MNILFLGLIYDVSEEEDLIENSKSGLGIASNILQLNTIIGLSKLNSSIEVLSAKPVGNYPFRNNQIFYNNKTYLIDSNIKVEEVTTFNLPLVKDFYRIKQFKKYIQNWNTVNKNYDDPNIIIMYDLNISLISLIPWIKKNYPDIYVFLFIPDLVGELRNKGDQSTIERLGNSIKNNNLYRNIELSDGYILITENMIEKLPQKKYVEINGIVKNIQNKSKLINLEKDSKVIFMYSGYLSKQYDIDKLILSILNSEEDKIELWLCGYGEMEEWIKNINSKKIKFFGLLSKKEVSELEKKATVLVNSRPNYGEYTKYSFPSKNLEYLNSGKPVVCYKLDGIPNVFDEYFDYITEEESIQYKINKYAEMSRDEIELIGKRNKDFVQENYSPIIQSRKIIGLIKDVILNDTK